jgi:hypothetical protein
MLLSPPKFGLEGEGMWADSPSPSPPPPPTDRISLFLLLVLIRQQPNDFQLAVKGGHTT